MHTHAHAHAQSLQSYTATVAEVLQTEVVKVQCYHLINEAPVRRKSQEGDMAMPFSIYYGSLCLCKILTCPRTYFYGGVEMSSGVG